MINKVIACCSLLCILMLCSCGEDADKPNVVLIIIDAVRADHLGCYGYERNTSPALDSLAETGLLVENLQAQSPWTLPAVTSVFTGLNARQHGAGRRGSVVYSMNRETPTLPVLLHRNGYKCMGIFNVYLLSEQFGFNRGFDRYTCSWLGHGEAANSVNQAIEWMSTAGDSPFFLSLHLFDPHDPYDPPSPFDKMFTPEGSNGLTWWPFLPSGLPDSPLDHLDYLTGMYDGEIAWTDSQLSRLFASIRELQLDSNTYVIVISDHGEEFLDHRGIGHGKSVFQEVLHLPCIISGPGVSPGISYNAARAQLEVFTTILEMTGTEPPVTVQGSSLLEETAFPMIASSNVNSSHVPIVASIRSEERKLIWDEASNQSIQFDLACDPHELAPLPPDSDLVNEVLYYWGTPPILPPETSDREMIESALRDLGYF